MATSIEQIQPKAVRRMPQPPPPANRGLLFLHALAFVLGFGIVFTLLGLTASFFGQQMREFAPILQRLGAILLFIFSCITGLRILLLNNLTPGCQGLIATVL